MVYQVLNNLIQLKKHLYVHLYFILCSLLLILLLLLLSLELMLISLHLLVFILQVLLYFCYQEVLHYVMLILKVEHHQLPLHLFNIEKEERIENMNDLCLRKLSIKYE